MQKLPPMRRKDKQLDNETTLRILNEASYGTLALYGKEGPYCLPTNFVFRAGEIFIHCADEGYKLSCISFDTRFCFNAVMNIKKQDEFTFLYQSVSCFGTAEIIVDEVQKRDALKLLCKKYYDYSDEIMNTAIDKDIARTVIIKLSCEFISGKGKI